MEELYSLNVLLLPVGLFATSACLKCPAGLVCYQCAPRSPAGLVCCQCAPRSPAMPCRSSFLPVRAALACNVLRVSFVTSARRARLQCPAGLFCYQRSDYKQVYRRYTTSPGDVIVTMSTS